MKYLRVLIALAGIALLVGIMTAGATVRWRQDPGVSAYGLSTDTKPTTDQGGRALPAGTIFTETDTGKQWIYTGAAWTLKSTGAASDTLTIRAPGYGPAIATAGYSEATFGVKVTNANTSATFRFLGKMTGLDWASLDAENDSTVVTGNSTVYRSFSFPAGLDSIKTQFLSEAGGTDATPTLKTKLSNPAK